jgi:phospholipid/cholesterol/gamma-HCH transport system substrate-binding protein
MSSILNEQDARFRGLNLKVGIFIALAVAIGVVVLAGLAVRQGVFAAKTQIDFQAMSGQDLRTGMAVKLSGFKVGEVSKVSLNEEAQVNVEMQIEDRYLKWVKADSVAVLSREGMIGDSFIAMTAGNPTLPSLIHGGRVRFESGRGLADIAQDMRNRVVPVIDEVTTLLHEANNPKGDVRQTLKEVHLLVAELRQTRKQVDKAVAGLDRLQGTEVPETLLRLRTTLKQADTTLGHADATLQHVDQQVPILTQQLGQSLQNVDKASAAATQAAQKATAVMSDTMPRVNALLDDTRGVAHDTKGVLGAMRNHWPFTGTPVVSDPAPPAPMLTSGN